MIPTVKRLHIFQKISSIVHWTKNRTSREMKLHLLFLGLLIVFSVLIGDSNQSRKTSSSSSSVIFPVTGNVYPIGYYHVTMNIGNPPKPFFLDIDSGSDLTWLQCDAPCSKCTPAPHNLYKPNKDLVRCGDPLCSSLAWPTNQCESQEEQCDYEVEYADRCSSMGVLVRDLFSLKFNNGTYVAPRLTFGCGYDQEVPDSIRPPYIDGVLGLAKGKSSIVSQLHDLGLIGKVLGHCLSTEGGGFIFFGDDLVPSSGVTWTPMSRNSLENHYASGPAELHYGGKAIGFKDIPVVFDSGSTYSYFNSDVYGATITMMKKNLDKKKFKDAVDDQSLPICWKGAKPFKHIDDVKNDFKALVLSFKKGKKAQLQMSPESYLIITEYGNACLGILNGTEAGLGKSNIFGDISLLGKMVIYDNENQQIGWVAQDCGSLHGVGRNYMEEISHPYASNMCIREDGSIESKSLIGDC